MTDTPPTPTALPRLERPRDGRMALGVCAGVAKHFNLDPTLVRVVFAVVTFLGGVGVLAYVAGFLLIPEEGEEQPILRGGGGRHKGGQLVTATILIAIGAIAIFHRIDFSFHGDVGWGVVLIVVGGYFLFRLGGGDAPAFSGFGRTAGATSAPDLPPTTWGAVAPDASDDASRDDTTIAAAPGVAPVDDATAETEVVPPATDPDPARRRSSRRATVTVLGGVLIAIGAAVAAASIAGADVSWQAAGGALVIVAGVGIAAGSAFGASPAIVVPAFLAAALIAASQAAGIELKGGAGERSYHPTTVADLRGEYRLGAGDLRVDLRDLRLPPGVTRVKATLGLGELVVRVPDGVGVRVDAHAGAGNIRLFDRDDQNGFDVDASDARGLTSPRILEIDADVGLGDLSVRDSTSTLEPR